MQHFYPRPPRGGRQQERGGGKGNLSISIHALREEGDQREDAADWWTVDFYPRPPRGGRRGSWSYVRKALEISIHALREEGDSPRRKPGGLRQAISIHALREEGDLYTILYALRSGISIHALREEGDRPGAWSGRSSCIFLSTPSARRATRSTGCVTVIVSNFYPRPPRGGRPGTACPAALSRHFYPRPPRGGRPQQTKKDAHAAKISIHALREEGDTGCFTLDAAVVIFLSTPSARRATDAKLDKQQAVTISIHALREEGDKTRMTLFQKKWHFYPRPPRGGRLAASQSQLYSS